MIQKILLHIFLIFSFFNITYSQSDSTATTKRDIRGTIKHLIEKHYQKEKLQHNQQQHKLEKENKIGNKPALKDKISEKREKLPPEIVINDSAKYSRFQEVDLKISAPGAQYIKLANEDEDLQQKEWLPVTSSMKWVLTAGNGKKRVSLQLLYPDSTTSSVYFDEIILVPHSPIASFTATPDTGVANKTLFSFDASSSEHTLPLFYRWDWEDDGTFDTEWSSECIGTHLYKKGGGKKTVRLEVKDEAGWVVATIRKIFVYTPPHAEFEYFQNFNNPLIVTFDASPSIGEELLVRWNFNNDSTWDTEWSTNKRVIHTFEDFDNPVVSLEVKNSQGVLSSTTMPIENKFADMVFIPAGNFNMGSTDFEIDEQPVHTVFVRDYWIDKFPVTNQQYAKFLNTRLNVDVEKLINLHNPDSKIHYVDSVYVVEEGYENHPVILVSWYGALAYAQFYGKSLPTEAEWEKAARGNKDLLFPWGNEIDSSRANYWDSGDPFDNNTTPVGFYNGRIYNGFQTTDSPSPYGVYDLVGNVREWCNDWYRYNYYSHSPLDNPTGPETGIKKVVRGGGFLFKQKTLRTTFRSAFEPQTTANYIGFRCVARE